MQNKAVPKTGVRFRVLQQARVTARPSIQPLLTSNVPIREYRNWWRARSETEETTAPVSTREESDGVSGSQHYVGKKALVVGAGPAGSVAAAFLAKQGFDVEVFEKRDDPTQAGAKVERPIPMLLTQATANVVRAKDIELPSTENEYKNGLRRRRAMIIVSKNGPLVRPPPYREERFAATRSDFAKSIMANVRDKNPEKITFHFEHPCIDVDLTKQQVQFRDQDNNIVTQDYDLLVGADGANSEVRKAMQDQDNDFKVKTTPQSVFYMSYRNLTIDLEKVPKKYKIFFEPGYITFFRATRKKGGIEGLRSISFVRAANGMMSGSCSGTETGFDSIKKQEKKYLNEIFPDDFPKEWIDQAVLALMDSPMHKVPSIIEVSSLIGPSVVLIGDAGHAVSPTIGFGCNMAIQDGQALNDALQFAKGDIKAALERFNDIRHKEVKECLQLEKFASAANGGQKGLNQLLFIFTKMHNMYHLVGNRYIPQLIPEPVLQRHGKGEISVKEALQTLQLELGFLLVVFAVILVRSVKTIVGFL